MPLQAEQLPSEIWLYIFTFFEGHDLVRAFSCLNSFFDSLLHSSHLLMHIRIKPNEFNERLPESTWSHINLENIYSLGVGRRKANCLIQFLRWNAQYLVRLSSLSVYLRRSKIYYNAQFLIFALEQIPSLRRLRIKYLTKFDRYVDHLEPLMAYIFSQRSTIQTYSLISDMSDYNMITSKWSINPSIKYLHVGEMSSDNLFSLLSLTPHLYSLQAMVNTSSVVSYESFALIHLKKVNLRLYRSRFHELQILKEIAPNLQSLRLRGSFNDNDDDFYNEKLWYQLFNNIRYFQVALENSAYDDTKKIELRNHIRNWDGKSWFSYQETKSSLTVSIKFKSTTM
jgi:hypothetical protein